MRPDTGLFWIGEYGWCLSEAIAIAPASVASGAVWSYIRSASFGTRFLEPEDTSLHGPFNRAHILPNDFALIQPEQLIADLTGIRSLTGFVEAPTDEQWSSIHDHVNQIVTKFDWLHRLELNEESKSRQHSGGFEFWVFREYFLASQGQSNAYRLVFAYD